LPFIARTVGTRRFEYGDIILPYESRFIRIEKGNVFLALYVLIKMAAI